MEHLALGIAHVVLQLAEQRDGGSSGHRLEHILLPVLTHRLDILGNLRREVRGDGLLQTILVDHTQHLVAIADDSVVELLATTAAGREHHLIGCLEVFFVTDILHVTIAAIGFLHNGQLQLVSQIVELVAQSLHFLRLIIPLLDLLRVLLHLHGEVVVYGLILPTGVLRGALQTLLNNGEAIEHLGRDVQCQHSHQHDIHQVDHLLARRNGSFLDSHNFKYLLSPASLQSCEHKSCSARRSARPCGASGH